MVKVAPNSKFFGHSTEIIQQSKTEGPLILVFFDYPPTSDILKGFPLIL